MRIEEDIKLDYGDVLFRPKRSTLSSRKDVELKRTYKFKYSKHQWSGTPIIAANMDGVGELNIAKILSKFEIMTCLTKQHDLKVIKRNAAIKDIFPHITLSTGTSDKDYKRLNEILKEFSFFEFICIDIANGYSDHFSKFVRSVREKYPTKTIIAGNVVTADMTQELVMSGADIVKVGIGPGSVCTTRIQTGVGYPQLSAVIECADAAHGLGAHIIADGGCTCPGDVAKAFGGGIVGEVGWKKLRIGGHDYLGEAFLDFQLKIKALKDQGIILAVASKNEETTAVDAINNHPEMVLSMNDFATYRINWEDKAKNISEIVNELNLGLQSVVFFDDSSFERERVRAILPEVFVPDLPKDPTEYSNFISKLHCFDSNFITDEDRLRSDLYKSEFKRTKFKNKYKSLSGWIDTLNLEILIENITNKNSPRTLQLINKTNQMNLSTRRLTEKDFNNWVTKKNNYMWTIRAKDKFGDYGIIGVLSITIKDKIAYMVDFIFSCRIVGRFIEDSTIQFLKEFSNQRSLKKINGLYKKTKKNVLIYKFLQRLKIIKKKSNSFIIFPTKEKIKLPNIKIAQPKFKRI